MSRSFVLVLLGFMNESRTSVQASIRARFAEA